MQPAKIALDPRYFQVIFQGFFLLYGIFFFGWSAYWWHYLASVGGCLFFNYLFECYSSKAILPLAGKKGFHLWGLSVLISAASLCLLLKTNHVSISLLTAFLTVASKYIFRYKNKHLFNPSAFGIVAVILLSNEAWLSPGQWGNKTVLVFAVVTLGTIVTTKVQKLDISLAFLITYIGLLYWRQIIVLGWPADHFIHSVSTGSLLLFSFFMISDPKTAPDHPIARIIWAVLIAIGSFYFSAFQWKHNTPVWVLVAAAPPVLLLDMLFRKQRFKWTTTTIDVNFFPSLKKIIMKPLSKKLTAFLLLALMISYESAAFCGFYVSKADGTLRNKTSQVILVRDGLKNVITMYNDFKGNLNDFAMVVPVPVVLKKSDIKVVDQQIFSTLNEYSKPRLVEYYDQNPCNTVAFDLQGRAPGVQMEDVVVVGYGAAKKRSLGVRVEAKYIVGEYDILILSAKESSGLKTWLDQNGYKIPAGADEVLEPYIKSNLKFFVVKVNKEEKKKLPGNFLRPIQIRYSSPKFMLPIRLGMANADGDQDMLVYAFSKKGRIECTNYRTVSLPTAKKIPLFVKNNFSAFYTNLFQHQWKGEGKAIAMLEYAWDVSPKNYVKCDPCIATAPSAQDLAQAGVWWIGRDWMNYEDDAEIEDYSDQVYFTRLHLRYNRQSFPQDLIFQVTPNKENYQARYIITHPATGDFDCDAGKNYVKELKKRRQEELGMLAQLTGKGYQDWDVAINTLDKAPFEASYSMISSSKETKDNEEKILFAALGVVGLVSMLRLKKKNSC